MSRTVAMWELSTAHIDPKERNFLEAWCASDLRARITNLPRFVAHEYGWFMPISRDVPRGVALAENDLPSLASVYAAALSRGVEWVYFDRDAETDPNLASYEDEGVIHASQ